MGENPHHQICFTPGQAVGLFQKAGFRGIRVWYDNGELIPESEMWTGETINGMLVISGYNNTRLPLL